MEWPLLEYQSMAWRCTEYQWVALEDWLMTSSYLVGCSTGRSAGFSPLRMRST
jgi:hypothetical protein